MDETTWTIIGTAVALFVALSAVMQLIIMSLKNELRAEFKQAIAELRAELKQDLAEQRAEFQREMAEFRQDMAAMRAEFRQDMAEQRAEFKRDMAEQRAEFKQALAESNADLSSKIQANRTEIIANRRIIYRLSLHRHGADGRPLAPLTDALEPPDFGSGSDNGEGGIPPA